MSQKLQVSFHKPSDYKSLRSHAFQPRDWAIERVATFWILLLFYPSSKLFDSSVSLVAGKLIVNTKCHVAGPAFRGWSLRRVFCTTTLTIVLLFKCDIWVVSSLNFFKGSVWWSRIVWQSFVILAAPIFNPCREHWIYIFSLFLTNMCESYCSICSVFTSCQYPFLNGWHETTFFRSNYANVRVVPYLQ